MKRQGARRFPAQVSARLHASAPQRVAEGVWLIRGGFPLRTMNVYLIRDGDGVLAFDAGIAAMAGAVAEAAAGLGGLTRVVLGHGHQDHRGTAPSLGVPVHCHAEERVVAEGDGGYGSFDFSRLNWAGRAFFPRALPAWDGGPVKIDSTFAEGDEIAGFEVVHFPGHSPGLVGLWRPSDRLALVSDTIYTINPQTGRKGTARIPHPAFTPRFEQARTSIRKLAALAPATVWAGHGDAVTGDVERQLEAAAAGR